MTKQPIYIVVDIEADGLAPGKNSMLSIGAVATTQTSEVDRFYVNLRPLKDAAQSPRTMEWWKTQPEAWAQLQVDRVDPKQAIERFIDWVKSLKGEPIFVSQPTAFDYAYIDWYLNNFDIANPFMTDEPALRTLDLFSYVAGKFDLSPGVTRVSDLPEYLIKGMPKHSHMAIDDAVGYAKVLRNALNEGS